MNKSDIQKEKICGDYWYHYHHKEVYKWTSTQALLHIQIQNKAGQL